MLHISWKESYSVGVKLLDDQHIKIIEIINELYDAITTGTSRIIIKDIIQRLYDYTNYHFQNEEELLLKNGYEKLSYQLSEHKYFIERIDKFKMDMEKGDLLTPMKTADFLKDWIISHILGTDKEYTVFLNNLGIN